MSSQKNLGFFQRLKFAYSGILATLRKEKSFRTQTAISIGMLLLSLVIRPDLKWCAIFCLCIGNVLSFELINSAVESICDFTTSEFQPQIKFTKDCAAGAVLISSIASVFIFLLFLLSLRS